MPGGPVIDEEGLAVQSTGEPIEPLGQERKKIAMSQKEDPNGDRSFVEEFLGVLFSSSFC